MTQPHLSNFFLSIKNPHNNEDIINIPPYVAYTLPNVSGWNVRIIPYIKRMIPPNNPNR